MKIITLEYPDGTIAIRGGITPRFLARFQGDRDAALQHIIDVLVPEQNQGAVARVEDIELPASREFRNAWRRRAGGVVEDLPAAKEIQIARIEARRRRKARDLLEREMIGENITAEKSALRTLNARALVEAKQSVDELRGFIPPGVE